MSKRYIEVEPLIELIDEYIEEYDTLEDGYHNPKWCAMQEARRSIEKQPVADVVEVIRCKDCYMYRKDIEIAEANNFNPDIYCALHQTEMPENGYCNYGREKRNDR